MQKQDLQIKSLYGYLGFCIKGRVTGNGDKPLCGNLCEICVKFFTTQEFPASVFAEPKTSDKNATNPKLEVPSEASSSS